MENRHKDISRKGDSMSTPYSGIEDIDTGIFYYLNTVVRPTVVEGGSPIPVPVLYGTPEKWKAVQRDGAIRDKNGKIQTPMILVQATGVEKIREHGMKVDGNNPQNFITISVDSPTRNTLNKFTDPDKTIPEKEIYSVAVPDHVRISYQCKIITSLREQANHLVELINSVSDSYWGEPGKFQYRSQIDSFDFETEYSDKVDRIFRVSFNITLTGFLFPRNSFSDSRNFRKGYSASKISFSVETVE